MKTVLVTGCFDPLHPGHLLHFEAAKRFGERLVVAVTKDLNIDKGPGRPAIPEDMRLKMVSSLRCVDEAILTESSRQALEMVKPDVFVLGIEYRTNIDEEDASYCAQENITIGFTNERTFSSTSLLSTYEP